MEHASLLCHRCGTELRAGEGNFYLVRIEAFADPTPQAVSRDELENIDLQKEMARLVEQMRGLSERELTDQVHRRLTICLCGLCYRQWIEDPAGTP